MGSDTWSVDFSQINELEGKMKQIPAKAEQAINSVLHTAGISIVVEEIQPEIPLSKWKSRVRRKKHARDVLNPHSSKKDNLAFTIRPKPKFNYLKYPDLGIGQSHRNSPLNFMKKGLDKATPKIMDKLSKKLDDTIKEALGG